MKKRNPIISALYFALLLFLVFSLAVSLPGCAPEEEPAPTPTPEPAPDPDIDDDQAAEPLPATKEVVMIVEGMEEVVELTLHENQQLGYYIYIDEDRYQVKELNGTDKITPLPPADDLPEVFMEISRAEDISPADKASQLKAELEGNYEEVSEKEEVQSPLQGYYLYAAQGSQWDDLAVRYYLVEDAQGNSLVIKQQLFMETWEGHGARLDQMLEEFGIL
ncbi:MAG: hypothetical protein D5R97_09465 [Candidatus Syntrophonatronum acetioxidans]|uniref:Uncharacterized protein n=1 Tax=Candidatus Syntrophonatronum acetioxidans TaxID=1795816 RepID=A0A424YAA8_9FIRM|nr:MAG: hypothetical protein D5R97_09465 [Candidatus Syntrophonatronum acetioxidans]